MKKYSKLISCIVLIATMLTLLTGCGEIKKAETTINNTFSALKEADFETASNHLNIDDMMKSEDESESVLESDSKFILENLFGKLDYEIISSEKIDKNTVVVKTKITTIDMGPIFTEFMGKAIQYAFQNAFSDPQPSEEETNKKMEEMLVECMSKEDAEMVTKTVDIKVVKANKNWKIVSSDELASALLGGLDEAAEEINNSLNAAE